MNASELVNRGAAYYGAKAKYLAGKVSVKEANKTLNKEWEKGYDITEKDAVDFARSVAERTQFVFGPIDTPAVLGSDVSKVFLQFQSFTLKQQERIMRQISEGEWVKLGRYLASSGIIFTTLGKAFGMGAKDMIPFVKAGAPPIWKFITDLFGYGVEGEDDWGNALSDEDRIKGVGDTLFTNMVPVGAQMKRSADGIDAVSEGRDKTKGGQTKFKIDDTAENYIRGTLFGKYNLPEANKYYKEKEEKEDRASSKSGGSRF